METLERNVIKEPNDILLYSVEEGKDSAEPLLNDNRERRRNQLYSVTEIEDSNTTIQSSTKPTTTSIKTLRKEILTMDRDSKTVGSPERNFSEHNNWQDKTASARLLEKDIRKEKHEDEHSEKKTKAQKFLSTIKRGGRGHAKQESKAEKLDKSKEDADGSGDKDFNDNDATQIASPVKYRDAHSTSKARPTTMYDLDTQEVDKKGEKEKNNDAETKSKQKDSQRNSLFLDDDVTRKNKSNSSFHEYIPGHNVPLKERLRRKQQEQIEKTGYESVAVVPDRSLAQRASKIIRAKYHGNEKNDDVVDSPTKISSSNNNTSNNSLTSKLFRRFKGGEKEIYEREKQPAAKDENKASVRRRRRRTKSNDNDEDANDNNTKNISTISAAATITTTTTTTTTDIAISSETNNTQLSAGHDIVDVATNDQGIIEITEITAIDEGDVVHSTASGEINLSPSPSKESMETDNPELEDNKETNTEKQTTEINNDAPVVYRRKKKTNADIHLMELKRKSLFVYEEEIVPNKKTAESLRLNFRSPDRSCEEVEEDVMVEANVRNNEVLNDDIFDCLRETVVNEDEPMVIESRSEVKVDDSLFEKLDQITPPPLKEEQEPVFFSNNNQDNVEEVLQPPPPPNNNNNNNNNSNSNNLH